ncbi:MAG: sigma-70 family RNA polymerase sigma factor [Oscillospiraceae bacterium]
MTNEALAELIKQGDNNELLPILWEKNAKLLYKLSNRTYRAYKDALNQHGIELDDLIQESYDVLLGAVEAYDPAKGFQLTTYFKYQFKQAVRRMLGGSDALNQPNTMSFEEPLTADDEDLTLADTIADPTAGDGYARAEMGDYYKPLYQAIESLEPDDREIIEMRFFSNPEQLMSYTEMGERLGGLSIGATRQRINKALNKLRYGRIGRQLWAIYGDDITAHTFSDSLTAFRKNGASGVELMTLARIQSEERLKEVRTL